MKACCVHYGKGVLNLRVKRIIQKCLVSGSVVIIRAGLLALGFTGIGFYL